MSPPSKTALSSALALTLRMIVMPTTGLSLRSSLQSLQVASLGESGSMIFSTLPLNTPFVSTMRTRDFSFLVLSSTVFHRPAGVVDWPNAETAAPASTQAMARLRVESLGMVWLRSEKGSVEVHHRRGAG